WTPIGSVRSPARAARPAAATSLTIASGRRPPDARAARPAGSGWTR
ncbi:MAG: hypothetical protein AVDCRST_MAG09-2086, partial [uncultured Sphingomonas sp.]